MSIEMENPTSTYERVDAALNYVFQMNMAKSIKDEEHYKFSFDKAVSLLSEAIEELDAIESTEDL